MVKETQMVKYQTYIYIFFSFHIHISSFYHWYYLCLKLSKVSNLLAYDCLLYVLNQRNYTLSASNRKKSAYISNKVHMTLFSFIK